jgi:hypothetical protein
LRICCTPATASGEPAAFDRRGDRVADWVMVLLRTSLRSGA